MPQKVSLDTNTRDVVQRAEQISDTRATVPSTSEKKKVPIPRDPLRKLVRKRPIPVWMSLLPSNVNSHVKPPSHSITSRRLSFPFYSSSSNPSPYITPLQWPIAHDDYTVNHPKTPPHLSLDGNTMLRPPDLRKRHSSTKLASLLVQTQELFSPRNAIWHITTHTQPPQNLSLAQSKVTNHLSQQEAISSISCSSFDSPDSFPPANCTVAIYAPPAQTSN